MKRDNSAVVDHRQTAEYCGVDSHRGVYKMLRDLEIRRIGVRGGVMPLGRLIRIEGDRCCGCGANQRCHRRKLPRWVTLKQAGDYYQVSPNLIAGSSLTNGSMLAHRSSASIRIDRESLLGPCHDAPLHHHRGSSRLLADQ